MTLHRGAIALLGGLTLSCNAVFGVSDLTYDGAGAQEGGTTSQGGATSTGGTTSMGGTGGGGGSAGAGGTGAAGAGGSLPGPDPVVRYRLDEQNNGDVSMPVLDSAPGGSAHLEPGPEDGQVMFYDQTGADQTGIRWDTAGSNHGLRVDTAATQLQSILDGATELTVEVVVDVEGATNTGSRIFHVGPPNAGESRFNFRVFPGGNFSVEWNNIAGNFALPINERVVMHAVVDATEQVQAERLRLYVDGGRQTPSGNINLPQHEALDIPDTSVFNLGNRDCCRSLQGTIFYFALYAVPASEGWIEARATYLAANDDAD